MYRYGRLSLGGSRSWFASCDPGDTDMQSRNGRPAPSGTVTDTGGHVQSPDDHPAVEDPPEVPGSGEAGPSAADGQVSLPAPAAPGPPPPDRPRPHEPASPPPSIPAELPKRKADPSRPAVPTRRSRPAKGAEPEQSRRPEPPGESSPEPSSPGRPAQGRRPGPQGRPAQGRPAQGRPARPCRRSCSIRSGGRSGPARRARPRCPRSPDRQGHRLRPRVRWPNRRGAPCS